MGSETTYKNFHAIFSLLIGRGLLIIGQIVTIKIATTLLTPSQFGSINQLISLAVLLCTILTSPVSLYIGRGFIEWGESGVLIEYIKKFIKYVIQVSLISIIGVWLIQTLFSLLHGVAMTWILVLLGLYIVGQSISTFAISSLNIIGRVRDFVFYSNLSIWGGLLLSVIFYRVTLKYEFWILGQFLGIFISTISIFYLIKYIKSYFDHSIINMTNSSLNFNRSVIFTFAWPQVVTLVLWWIQSQGYRFILDRTAGLEYVGKFSIAYSLCSVPMSTFEALFNQYYSPIFYYALKRQDFTGKISAWNEYAKAYIPAVILMGSFVISSGPFLVKVFLGDNFQDVYIFLIWPAITETLRAINSVQHFWGIAKVDMKVTILPVIIGSIVSTGCVLYLSRMNPLSGTGIALLLASFSVLITVLLISRGMRLKWPVRESLYAVLLSLPLFIGFKITYLIISPITFKSAISVLLIAGIYLCIAEYILGEKWIKLNRVKCSN